MFGNTLNTIYVDTVSLHKDVLMIQHVPKQREQSFLLFIMPLRIHMPSPLRLFCREDLSGVEERSGLEDCLRAICKLVKSSLEKKLGISKSGFLSVYVFVMNI